MAQLPRLENTSGLDDTQICRIIELVEEHDTSGLLSSDLVRILVELDNEIERLEDRCNELKSELKEADSRRTDF